MEDIFRIEQATDLAHREVTAFLVEHVDHDRALHLLARIADVLEVTADALVRSAFRTRERVLSAHRRRS